MLLVKSSRVYRNPAIIAAVDPFHAHAKPAALDAKLLATGAALARGTGRHPPCLPLLHAAVEYVANADGTGSPDRISREMEDMHGEQVAAAFDKLAKAAGIPPARRHLHMGNVTDQLCATVQASARRHGRHGCSVSFRTETRLHRQHCRDGSQCHPLRRAGRQAASVQNYGASPQRQRKADAVAIVSRTMLHLALALLAFLFGGCAPAAGSATGWVRRSADAQALAMMRVLRNADEFGLRTEDYQGAWSSSPVTLPGGDPEPEVVAQFDESLSTSVAHFLHDVHFGRVDPRAAGFNLASTRAPLNIALLLAQLQATGDPDRVIASVEPQFLHYQLLKQALARYRLLAAGAAAPTRCPRCTRHPLPARSGRSS